MTNSQIDISHGSGGKNAHKLIHQLFFKYFDNDYLCKETDAALLPPLEGRIVFSTDSHVVSPLFFPGGNIGTLAICGTINDIAAMGAHPKYLSIAFIIEEGFEFGQLETIVQSLAQISKEYQIPIVCGDTKVVERGAADGLFINVSGIGNLQNATIEILPENITNGQEIIISGTMGDHGATILVERERLNFKGDLKSDCAPLHQMVAEVLMAYPTSVKAMRDPTRGGVSGTLHELAKKSQMNIQLYEKNFPIKPQIKALCEILGLYPWQLPNEGKMLFFVEKNESEKILQILKNHPFGRDAAIIGKTAGHSKSPKVSLQTEFGGEYLIPWPSSDPLPRIC